MFDVLRDRVDEFVHAAEHTVADAVVRDVAERLD